MWDRVSVGPGAQIEESFFASAATIGPEAKVGKGSVIGHDVTIDPGQVLEAGSRVGPAPSTVRPTN
ncbi:MAG: hypothetical protein JOY69_05725 [Candidatus Eremiobacteraeota bacterium]|nr:hypothetical protein [Candidatus Eremiobacteraeota bacterium]